MPTPLAEPFTITVGMPLDTCFPDKRTNAVVFGMTDTGEVNILTDFGNVLLLTHEEVHACYKPNRGWLEYIEYGGVHESIYQRIDMQITLLERAKAYVMAGTNNDRSPHG